ncbi:Glycoside hydrolase [Macleaya cordata]|uniref:Glycoside hydrolase n=1 Tax=Macleaya cordata TaxID=56857 RepID=A0A200QC51_MACCD|nr:Glycoside hydrolase [Macleaya cordata]
MSSIKYCDKSLSYEVRAKDLVDRMTLVEKIQQLGDKAFGVNRLGIPMYKWWSEALHGVSDVGPGTYFDDLIPGATSFPPVILTSASFDKSLWKNIGQVVSTEARAMYNLGRAELTYWSPTINVARDPRWGRITETPSEDPYVVGTYTSNYVKGLQDVQGIMPLMTLITSRELIVIISMPRLGFFEGSHDPSFEKLGVDDVCSQDHIELATEAAREGIVLLNNNNTLPFTNGIYKKRKDRGIPCKFTSPLDALSTVVNVSYAPGCGDIKCKMDKALIFNAMDAKTAEATIIFAGLDLTIEAESLDRVDLLLPGNQTQIINQVAAVAKGPVILVIMSAGGVDISFAQNDHNIDAILWAGYPGEEGGRAIADIVFGKCNPGGRLPITWYEADYVNKLPLTSMPLRPIKDLGYPKRTYKFYNGSTLYPFGYGLSYTNFTYQLTSSVNSVNVKLDMYQHCRDLNFNNGSYRPQCPAVLVSDMNCTENFEFEVEVENVGSKNNDDIVLVYSKPPTGIAETHLKQLIGFERVSVAAGMSKKVKFVFNACKSLNIVETDGYNLLPSGEHTIIVAGGAISFPLNVYFKQ